MSPSSSLWTLSTEIRAIIAANPPSPSFTLAQSSVISRSPIAWNILCARFQNVSLEMGTDTMETRVKNSTTESFYTWKSELAVAESQLEHPLYNRRPPSRQVGALATRGAPISHSDHSSADKDRRGRQLPSGVEASTRVISFAQTYVTQAICLLA